MYAELERKRTCYSCKIEKNLGDFGKDKTQKNGRSYKCIPCKKIRGLLCDNCNPGLGYFKDSEILLLKAVSYLKKFQK